MAGSAADVAYALGRSDSSRRGTAQRSRPCAGNVTLFTVRRRRQRRSRNRSTGTSGQSRPTSARARQSICGERANWPLGQTLRDALPNTHSSELAGSVDHRSQVARTESSRSGRPRPDNELTATSNSRANVAAVDVPAADRNADARRRARRPCRRAGRRARRRRSARCTIFSRSNAKRIAARISSSLTRHGAGAERAHDRKRQNARRLVRCRRRSCRGPGSSRVSPARQRLHPVVAGFRLDPVHARRPAQARSPRARSRAVKPPPPRQTSSTSSGPDSSISSSAAVPCPAMIAGSSYGGTSVAPRSRRDAQRRSRRGSSSQRS